MEIRVIRKPEPDDELMHFKYIKREKVNGKWRYYYDGDIKKATVKDIGGDLLGEASRQADKLTYDGVSALAKKEQENATNIKEYAGATAARGAAAAAKALNSIGDGKLDNKLIQAVEKFDSWVTKLFGKKGN